MQSSELNIVFLQVFRRLRTFTLNAQHYCRLNLQIASFIYTPKNFSRSIANMSLTTSLVICQITGFAHRMSEFYFAFRIGINKSKSSILIFSQEQEP